MIAQLDFDLPARRVPTSQAAAEAATAFAAQQRERVYAFLASRGAWGATQREASESLGIGRPSICARFWELAGGRRVGGVPQYTVRIHRTERRRERCAVYAVLP
ncbi:MAG TPA: hypothetical protein VNL98_06750 [Gemmatimonadales bacterium]|nr:hypothetical protein [Gemmatimonadales bacterium]